MSVFDLSISKVFQSALYYNDGPLRYNKTTGSWGPFTITGGDITKPLTAASAAINLTQTYKNYYNPGKVSPELVSSIDSTINTQIAAIAPPNGNYSDSNWQVNILKNTYKQLNSTSSTVNYYGQSTTFSSGTTSSTNTFDPLAQTFFVDSSRFPNGVFLSSVGLYFATKDPVVPVSIQIIGVTNGYPDISKPISGSVASLTPASINVPTSTNLQASIGPITPFYFDHPIYLPSGQYAIMIISNSNNYNVYASSTGQAQYGTTNLISSPTYTGVLFKSQNGSTWVPATGTGTLSQTVSECLCFNINICSFAGGSASFQADSDIDGPNAFNYDLLQLNSVDQSFNSLDSISYSAATTNLSNLSKNGFVNVLNNKNTQLATRQIQKNINDITLNCSLTNSDTFTSPVVDLHRLSSILIQNRLGPYNSANTVAESLPGIGISGGAMSKYITKRVTLNNNFNSTGITVYVDVNRQPGTMIEVYYKVMNVNDSNNFDNNPYVLMNPILTPGSGLPNTGPNDWTQDVYQALDITYNDVSTGNQYSDFNRFAIKICFYSSNPAIAPQIKNFRAIATA